MSLLGTRGPQLGEHAADPVGAASAVGTAWPAPARHPCCSVRHMIRRVGSWPRTQATKAMLTRMLFMLRGGMLSISRLVVPVRTCSSLRAISSTCQFSSYTVPGSSVCITRETKTGEVRPGHRVIELQRDADSCCCRRSIRAIAVSERGSSPGSAGIELRSAWFSSLSLRPTRLSTRSIALRFPLAASATSRFAMN